MKLFKIDYEYSPGSEEASIIYANSEEEALNIAKEESEEPIEKIEEVISEKGVIYTGYNCC